MTLRDAIRARLPALVLLGGAIYFAVGVLWRESVRPNAIGANDTYTYVYPSFIYALRSLRDGGGFFWNPYQDCGQPFFAISQTALLYPVNWIAALLEREPALIVTIVVNLLIAGVAVYGLGRTIGLSRAASLTGALAFQLGGSAMDMAAWSPVHIAPYAWMAMAMWQTERVVRRPSFPTAAALGGALAVELLPGFPQLVFFTYQVLALRVGWALLRGESPARGRLVRMAFVAAVLPLGLTAVQLLPSIEVARESLRTIPLTDAELGGLSLTWQGVRVLGSVDLMTLALAATALLGCRVARPTVVFYALIAALYFGLCFGPGTPLFDLYARLPMGSAFRGSPRLLWVVGFALAVLAGCGAQAILDLRAQRTPRTWIAIVPWLLGGVALQWVFAADLRPAEWLLAAALCATALAAARGHDAIARIALPALVIFHGVAIVPKPFSGLLAGDLYHRNAGAFALVRERLTAQERVLIVGRPGDYSLMPKSGMLFAVPDVFDYEPQVTRSYAEFFTYMRTGRGMRQLNDWYWIFRSLLPDTVQPRLLDLMAVRYVLVDRTADRIPPALAPRLSLVGERDAVRIYENRSALPRAFYVPRVVVKPAEEILPALVDGSLDPVLTAAVSVAPESGFLGSAETATGSAEIIENAPERVAVRVRAGAPGFLYLADQIFPGWSAHVNGVAREIARANYTFRLVEVPAGDSEVVFTYRSRFFWPGAVISLFTIALVAYLLRRRGA